jgi:phosphocarrier protein
MFVKLAGQYQSRIEVIKDSERVDGKSILNILTLAAVEGTTLQIEATGSDAEAALDALVDLVARNFPENGSVD